MGNIVSAASAFRLSKSYLPAHSTFYNAVSISLRSFADAARMWCAEAKMGAACGGECDGLMQPVCGVLRQRMHWVYKSTRSPDAARMWCAEAKSTYTSAPQMRCQDAARMWCAEAKFISRLDCKRPAAMQPVCGVLRQSSISFRGSFMITMQPVCGVLRQSPMTLTFISMPHDAAHMWC